MPTRRGWKGNSSDELPDSEETMRMQDDLGSNTQLYKRSQDTIRGAEQLDRFKPLIGWIMFGILMLYRPLEDAPIPGWVVKMAVLIGFFALARHLIIFPRWNDELKYIPRFMLIFGISIVELLVENYCVWVVAASNTRKYDLTFVPLQDNVALASKNMMRASSLVNTFLTWHWGFLEVFMFVFLCMCFGCLFDQLPYSGFGIASRAVLMHCVVRTVRTVSFLAVVMPNSRTPQCYSRRFPPVPDGLWDYFITGASTLKGMGGCNDLIISGHGCTWMMAVMAVWTYYPYGPLKYIVALAYAQSALRISMEGWHYSVDFILPAVLCCLIWRELSWVYPESSLLPARKVRAPRDPVSKAALWSLVAIILFVLLVTFYTGG